MGKKETFSGEELNAFLDQGSEFEGKLVFRGTVRIDGKFKGEIISEDNLVIGDTGEVEGTIKVGSLRNSGKITGKVFARERIDFLSPGSMEGEIYTPRLTIEDGFTFNGKCTMSEKVDLDIQTENEATSS